LDGLYRIILNDLRNSWQAVSTMEFSISAHETQPALLQILAPNEAVVAVSMEVRVGDNAGMMNIGIPSIIIKMLRHKFDQQWSIRRSESTEQEQSRILRLIKLGGIQLDGRLTGPTLTVEDLLKLDEGDVLAFDYPVDRPLDLMINGKLKYHGQIVSTGRKRALQIECSHQLGE
jgi:flagellar motor switch protein FliM